MIKPTTEQETPMLDVEPTSQRGRTVAGSGRNGNEAVAGAASQAFARRLHRRRAPVELPSAAGHIVLPHDTSFYWR